MAARKAVDSGEIACLRRALCGFPTLTGSLQFVAADASRHTRLAADLVDRTEQLRPSSKHSPCKLVWRLFLVPRSVAAEGLPQQDPRPAYAPDGGGSVIAAGVGGAAGFGHGQEIGEPRTVAGVCELRRAGEIPRLLPGRSGLAVDGADQRVGLLCGGRPVDLGLDAAGALISAIPMIARFRQTKPFVQISGSKR